MADPYVESFHTRVRHELLDVEEFSFLAVAQVLIADWRQDYNHLCRGRHRTTDYYARSFLPGGHEDFRAPDGCAHRSWRGIDL